ncbi:hypothetical protein [Burkholderia sp. Bp8963]|uniref:hypothetical protein n=1 Tax=Burkholderia sp. Bp8963 TaxID=2184547 RepID=UPI000F5A7944|nr:hypothetical protein [Burkholderia sp. Bp8963]
MDCKETQPKHPILDRIPRLRAAADQHGFDCLDHVWKGLSAMHRFRCRQGHVFERTLQTFGRTRHSKCPACSAQAHMSRLSELVRNAGVRCLEPHWLGWDVPHRFACDQGHTWSRTGNKALRHAGCPHCGRAAGYRRRLAEGLVQLQKTAVAHGGACLSTVYTGGAGRYRFRCAQGHEWDAQGADVARRTWCPTCARLRKVTDYRLSDGLARLQHMAARRGGLCLSDTYTGVGSRYRFRCAQGHEWETLGRRILRGGWCGPCANEKKRLGIAAAHEAAQKNGGQCLSTTYRNTTTKLHWLCERGHSWHACLATIRAGHWCAECAHMARIRNPNSKAWKRYRAVPLDTDVVLFAATGPTDTPP